MRYNVKSMAFCRAARIAVPALPIALAGEAIEHLRSNVRIFEILHDGAGVVELVRAGDQQDVVRCFGEMRNVGFFEALPIALLSRIHVGRLVLGCAVRTSLDDVGNDIAEFLADDRLMVVTAIFDDIVQQTCDRQVFVAEYEGDLEVGDAVVAALLRVTLVVAVGVERLGPVPT